MALQILEKADMLHLIDELNHHFQHKIIPTILSFQANMVKESTLPESPNPQPLPEIEEFILHVVDKLQVCSSERVIKAPCSYA